MSLSFDEIVIGQAWDRYAWEASGERSAAWLRAMGERLPDEPGLAGDALAFPPGMLLVMFSNYMDAMVPPRPPGMIYAKQHLAFGTPARVGDVLTTTMRVQGKYHKRERRIVELASATHNQRGERVLEGLRTIVWGGTVSGEAKTLAPAARHAGEDIHSLHVTITPDLVRGFTAVAGDRNATHYDDAAARAQGFPAAITHGAIAASIALRWVMVARARLFAAGDTLGVSFLAPVFAGDTVTARGRIGESAGDHRLYEVWCENQKGESVIAGTARVTPG